MTTLPSWDVFANAGFPEPEHFEVYAATLDDALDQGSVIAEEKGLEIVSIVDPEGVTHIFS